MAAPKTERVSPSRVSPAGKLEVPASLSGRPLDAVLRGLTGASWGDVRGWIRTGKVTLEGELVTDERRPARAGAPIEIRPAAPKPATRSREALGDELIVYLDPSVVVVDKPAGINAVVYGDEREGEWTLEALVRDLLDRRAKRGGGSRGRPPLGVVHRIDRPTTGLLVFARTVAAKKSLAQQFRVHSVHRRYLALVHGDARSQTLRSTIAEDRGDGLRGAPLRGRRGGQPAVTHVEVIERLAGATLIACRLETGRTHQIRIHLSEAGHPLLGERVYVRDFTGTQLPAPRLMLHAAELGFEHPATGEQMRFRREPPRDFLDRARDLGLTGGGGGPRREAVLGAGRRSSSRRE